MEKRKNFKPTRQANTIKWVHKSPFSPLKAQLNPMFYLLALLGAHPIFPR